MRPEITVLMPVYNAEKYLREAVDSVLAQTYQHFEFLIVNDGSTDSSLDILSGYKDPRIRIVNRENGGVSAALNTGLREAQGNYIVRFDADDICYPKRIELQYEFMKNSPEYILAGSDADYINKEGEFIFTFRNKGHSDEEIRRFCMESCPFIHSTVIYKKDVVMALGGYEVKAHTFEDYFLWVKLIRQGKVYNFKEALIKVRFNPESVTVDARDYSSDFRAIHREALQTGNINDEQEKIILNSIRRIDISKKELSYNRMLAKKFLWNNYQPQKARRHIREVLRQKPIDPMAYILFLLSLLPKRVIEAIYIGVK